MRIEDVVLKEQTVKETTTFRYLDTIIRKYGYLENYFSERLKMANQAMCMLNKVWRASC